MKMKYQLKLNEIKRVFNKSVLKTVSMFHFFEAVVTNYFLPCNLTSSDYY